MQVFCEHPRATVERGIPTHLIMGEKLVVKLHDVEIFPEPFWIIDTGWHQVVTQRIAQQLDAFGNKASTGTVHAKYDD